MSWKAQVLKNENRIYIGCWSSWIPGAGGQKVLQEVEMPCCCCVGFWLFPAVGWGLPSALCTGTVFTEHSCIFVQGCCEPLRGKLLFFLWNPSICHAEVPLGPPLPLSAQGHLRILWRLCISCFPALTQFSASPVLLGLFCPSVPLPRPQGLVTTPHACIPELRAPAWPHRCCVVNVKLFAEGLG